MLCSNKLDVILVQKIINDYDELLFQSQLKLIMVTLINQNSRSESLLSSAKVRAVELLPPNGPKPADLKIYNLVSRSDSNITTNSNISELKSLEVWN